MPKNLFKDQFSRFVAEHKELQGYSCDLLSEYLLIMNDTHFSFSGYQISFGLPLNEVGEFYETMNFYQQNSMLWFNPTRYTVKGLNTEDTILYNLIRCEIDFLVPIAQ